MNELQAILLGLLQGLTEFLPVSSSGHLIIAKHIFGIETEDLSFEIVVHAATVLSTIIVFRKELYQLLEGLFKFKYNDRTKYVCMILVSMIPVFIVGMFFKDYVTDLFGSGLLIVGLALIATSALLFFSEKVSSKNNEERKQMNYKSAMWMGLAQAVAVIPGLSRSGATISAGLMGGVKKEDVAQFSFLMVLIPVLGEAFLELICGGFSASSSSTAVLPLILGFLAAFASGLFACKVMIALVKKAKLKWFALYCIVVGITCVIWNSCM
ncbi:MAG: undecaprenyl-diphosphate phosphatase [Bacteroidales bacterium]|nr:undecaprenyl-diphosphate phosphatase [Bacteroidales bacterium]MDD4669474.1 undecaprenyl-diphosphate phosphatase [Bacteroidales bacterium]